MAPRPIQLQPRDALILVDVQRDFCPGGKLAVSGGDEVVPVLNRWIDAAAGAGATVAVSRDWHPSDHVSFAPRGGPWPEHCVQDTEGAELHPLLRTPADAILISKGTSPDFDQYSAFDRTGLADALRSRGVDRVWIGGLAQDVCVRATVLDAVREGFETHVLVDATRPVEAAAGDHALREMAAAGAALDGGPAAQAS
jgi:nicotinamidase/pyrazinamidase